MLSSTVIHLRQTSRHAILVLHFKGIDPLSVATLISQEQDRLQISFLLKEDQSRSCLVTLRAQPQLQQPPNPTGQRLATIQGCSRSVKSDNIVFKLIKAQDLEWQALHLAVKTCHVDNADNNKKGAMEIESDYAYDGDDDNTESILARFVTKANVTHLQDAIRTEQIWGSEHGHRVGNIQAKKISEMNAIQMSVELAAGDVPSS
ncbi:hypothetical protein BGX20_009946 [Mortierella sp. AD010]|nr:hypothetical protein BGX20_009946 [Mortierella sp. AD010]